LDGVVIRDGGNGGNSGGGECGGGSGGSWSGASGVRFAASAVRMASRAFGKAWAAGIGSVASDADEGF
jgi:hypothetical protein